MELDLIPQEEPESIEFRTRLTVLLIDDDQTAVEAMGYRFSQQGFGVLSADCCGEGIALARTKLPDLILMESLLPDGDGLQLCQEIVDDPATGDIPVVMVSKSTRPDIVRQARSAGAKFFVKKPCDPNVLLLLVNEAIADSRSWI